MTEPQQPDPQQPRPDQADDSAPGWDAIDAALRPLYAGQEPRHWGVVVPAMLGGNDPLQGVSAYARTEPVAHWHYVTYGFSELYAKESPDAEVSGYGFELTFRLAADVTQEPPVWPVNVLQNLARYVFATGNVFRPGEYMSFNGPIALGDPTAITEVIFTTDPELPGTETPNGHLDFVQVVGVTTEEVRVARTWHAQSLLDAVAADLPLWVTDLRRGSLLDDPRLRATVEDGRRREGSSSGTLFTDVLGWGDQPDRPGTTYVTTGAAQVRELRDLLPLRLPFGRPYTLTSKGVRVTFAPGESFATSRDASALTVTLPPAALDELLAEVPVRRGSYVLPSAPDLVLHVLPTEIPDHDGSVAETIG